MGDQQHFVGQEHFAAGPRRLDDADWRTAYARATHAILVKPMITIDVAAMAVTY